MTITPSFVSSGNFLQKDRINPLNNPNSDKEIVSACLRGDAVAQRRLYDTFAPRMMGLCLRYSTSRDEAQDILQEGFIKVFEKLGQFEGKGALGGWIRMIIINTALINIRKNQKWAHTEDVDDMVDLSNSDHSVLESMAADELMELVRKLPTGYRAVFNLFAIEGYGHKEIAKELGVSESTSKTQFKKARSYLHKLIMELENTH